ncbi:iron-containing alcohol dehydrogenase [candidate division KSB3 bacterium]|uniref:Iron-containing alcohol dehydrogenase n=1 Tax=candidate division KSB3 bacterium TaxID=2044937 RepID=A0A9D5Q4P6_9BACT|nr:iron-containing alcohol dehydrogenase [candidate division KSB3 bacterium]MBD3323775.1 iron-containing alcohol dehydrogenase [candidate division KSB3 bacterium]
MLNFDAYLPTRILVGEQKLAEIGHQASQYGSRAMLVTGKHSMKAAGFTDRVVQSLQTAGLTVDLFDKIDTNPTRESINEGGALARQLETQVVIGLGGGSALDSAKAIAALAQDSENDDVWQYVQGREAPSSTLPIIAAPSTAGTGSEVTLYTVITNKAATRKDGFASPYIYPRVAIIDPELMSTVPQQLTAYAGTDAFAQAVEAYLTKLAHPFSDLLALESIRLCAHYLPQVVADGKNLTARAAMGWASSLAGIAISLVDIIIAHHASEAVGALYETHHGATAGILLPYAMEFNLKESRDKLARIAEVMGADIKYLTPENAARKSIEAVRTLYEHIGVPLSLADLGVKKESIPEFVAYLMTRKGDLDAGNPRECTEASLTEYMHMACG